MVLPAFGGDTIIPLCPFPIGATKSIILVERLFGTVSNTSLSLGYMGVNVSKSGLSREVSGFNPLTYFTYNKALYFSPPDLGDLVIPNTLSPVF